MLTNWIKSVKLKKKTPIWKIFSEKKAFFKAKIIYVHVGVRWSHQPIVIFA